MTENKHRTTFLDQFKLEVVQDNTEEKNHCHYMENEGH